MNIVNDAISSEIDDDDTACLVLNDRPLAIRDLTRRQFKYIYGLARVYNEMCACSYTAQRYFEETNNSVLLRLCESIYLEYFIYPEIDCNPLSVRLFNYKKRKLVNVGVALCNTILSKQRGAA